MTMDYKNRSRHTDRTTLTIIAEVLCFLVCFIGGMYILMTANIGALL